MEQRSKKLWSILLTLTLLLSLLPGLALTASALPAEHTHTDPDTQQEVAFAPWTSATSLPDDGAYYLAYDVTPDTRWIPTGSVSLCLNGKNITWTGLQSSYCICVDAGVSVKVYDADGGSGVIKGRGGTAMLVLYPGSSFTLNGGTLSANNEGRCVSMSRKDDVGGTFIMNGGKITQGKSLFGAGVNMCGGTFIMNGGTITGNQSCGNEGNNYQGGGVYIQDGGTFIMNGGTITGNSAQGTGGGIDVWYAKFTMNGGSISGNTAGREGGGIRFQNGDFTVTGGSITGNEGAGTADNVYLINNYIEVAGNLEPENLFPLSGQTYFGPPPYFVKRASGYTGELHPENFPSEDGSTIVFRDGKLCYVHTHAEGMPGDDIEFIPWTDKLAYKQYGYDSSKTASNSLPKEAGSYALTQNVMLNATWTVPEGATNLCLNGKTVTFTGGAGHVIQVTNGTLNLYDCSQNSGSITGGKNTDYGGGVFVNGSGQFHMYGGSIQGNKATNYGGGVCIANSGAFIMDGGVISDNECTGLSDYHYGGGGVGMNNGSFTMNGGEISNNTAPNGGGIFAIKGENNSPIAVTIAGGIISGNSATATADGTGGGAIYANGNVAVNVSGGDIYKNSADTCGGIYLTHHNTGPYATASISGGTIHENRSTKDSGAIWCADYSQNTYVLSEEPQIYGNTYGNNPTECNLYVDTNRISLAYSLGADARIGVTMRQPGVFTDSTNTAHNDDTKFFSDDAAYTVVKDVSSQLALVSANESKFDVYYVASDAEGGTVPAGRAYVHDTLVTIPGNPGGLTKTGHDFLGWSLKADGSDYMVAGDTYTVSSDLTFHAAWQARRYTLTFQSDNATYFTITADYGEAIQPPADPTRDGYTFAGWSPEVPDTMPLGGLTVTAQWTQNPAPEYSDGGYSAPTTYIITVAETTGGTVKVSRTAAPRGAEVTVTATPAEGYELDTITAKDAKGNTISVTNGKFTMPAADVTVTATFKEKTSAKDSLTVEELLKMFTDLDPKGWYLDDVRYCVENGYMKGMGEGKFGPELNVSRAMIAQLLWNMAGNPEPESAAPFGDVAADAWYAKAVAWAYENGVTKGTGVGFEPETDITREQLAVMLYNYAKLLGKGFTGLWSFKLDFPDAGNVSDWATEAMSWMVMNGIINGTVDETGVTVLDPQGDATRAQLAAMVQRFCEAMAKE